VAEEDPPILYEDLVFYELGSYFEKINKEYAQRNMEW
jgi:hypothetical protein